jgi:hypothetical protein
MYAVKYEQWFVGRVVGGVDLVFEERLRRLADKGLLELPILDISSIKKNSTVVLNESHRIVSPTTAPAKVVGIVDDGPKDKPLSLLERV